MVDVVVWLLMGGVVGWMTSAIVHPGRPQGHLLNVCVGMVGAAMGGWLISPVIGADSMGQNMLNVGALLVALVSAILLLAITTLFQAEVEEPTTVGSALSDEP
ncbi:GlsB/YeaQ/YmgE family stress response membrane protein [Hydrogenophaga sp.]|uniref:GlsB/YeaQ/YmgE family stress response membrane protein n=1 Tax=Hydrogenophaga sp. TaxID=1904254 RepID=UPI00272D6605|nr:GlsB/YeaQ/YmgE family stress response membrane protein [Hydrogenophaga sp.]